MNPEGLFNFLRNSLRRSAPVDTCRIVKSLEESKKKLWADWMTRVLRSRPDEFKDQDFVSAYVEMAKLFAEAVARNYKNKTLDDENSVAKLANVYLEEFQLVQNFPRRCSEKTAVGIERATFFTLAAAMNFPGAFYLAESVLQNALLQPREMAEDPCAFHAGYESFAAFSPVTFPELAADIRSINLVFSKNAQLSRLLHEKDNAAEKRLWLGLRPFNLFCEAKLPQCVAAKSK